MGKTELNPENFDDGVTQVAPKGMFKAGKTELEEVQKILVIKWSNKDDSKIMEMMKKDGLELLVKKKYYWIFGLKKELK